MDSFSNVKFKLPRELVMQNDPGSDIIVIYSDLNIMTCNTSSTWLDSVLGQSKHGVFSADFEGKNNTVLEVGDGDSVMLDCNVFLKQEKTVRSTMLYMMLFYWFQVSWLRHTVAGVPDLLMVGKTTYTGDTRIKSSLSYPSNWRLEMMDLQKKDSGLYVCQMSTHPPVGLHTVIRVRGKIISYCNLREIQNDPP